MSLLDGSAAAHAPALKRFEARFRAGDHVERAVLMNLCEEDRVPAGKRTAFHAALAGSKRRAWKDRFAAAAPSAHHALPVPTPCPASIAGPWWHHVTLRALLKYGYVSRALRSSRPPRRLKLTRPMGRPAAGADRFFWITNAVASAGADDIRDRLGLCTILRSEELYRIRISVGATPSRPLFVPSALDAGFYPAWRKPAAGHKEPWGMTRHLATDVASEPELLAFPHASDGLEAAYVGLVGTDPPTGYLRARGIT